MTQPQNEIKVEEATKSPRTPDSSLPTSILPETERHMQRVYIKPVKCDCKAEHGDVYIVYADGTERQLTQTGMCYEPKLSPDQQTAGWLVGSHIYPGGEERFVTFVTSQIVLFRDGRIIHTFDLILGEDIFEEDIRDWRFGDDGKQVAVYYGTNRQVTSHFAGEYRLYDVATGRLVAEWSDDKVGKEEPPQWVKEISPETSIETSPSPSTPSSGLPYVDIYPITRQLAEQDLVGKSQWELRLMRNAVFARYGRPFVKSQELRDFFSKQPWYRPDPNWDDAKDDARISALDKANAGFIRDYEKRVYGQ